MAAIIATHIATKSGMAIPIVSTDAVPPLGEGLGPAYDCQARIPHEPAARASSVARMKLRWRVSATVAVAMAPETMRLTAGGLQEDGLLPLSHSCCSGYHLINRDTDPETHRRKIKVDLLPLHFPVPERNDIDEGAGETPVSGLDA